jgi:hypothetical protein
MKKTTNNPHKSKINLTALITSLIGLAAVLNVIPAGMEPKVTQVALLVGGPLTMVFRTWFN